MTVAEIAKSPVTETAAALPEHKDPWWHMMDVPALLSVEVEVVALTVRELYRLEKGSIVTTSQSSGANVPLRAGGSLLAWGEFQVVNDRLAIRVAELS